MTLLLPGAALADRDPPVPIPDPQGSKFLCESAPVRRPRISTIVNSRPALDQATGTTAAPTGGDFTLDAASGPVDLASLRGQVVLIYFGYTLCPDICPTNLAMIASALKALTPEERARVTGLVRQRRSGAR